MTELPTVRASRKPVPFAFSFQRLLLHALCSQLLWHHEGPGESHPDPLTLIPHTSSASIK